MTALTSTETRGLTHPVLVKIKRCECVNNLKTYPAGRGEIVTLALFVAPTKYGSAHNAIISGGAKQGRKYEQCGYY